MRQATVEGPDASAACIGAVVEQTLRRELERRQGLRPHVQLAIRVDADGATRAKAYRRLREQYDPTRFVRHGARAVALARRIGCLLDEALAQLGDPATPPPRPPGLLGRIFGRH
jgi:hypothetical protein